MAEFKPLKYIKKYRVLILCITILGSSLVYFYGKNAQSYTASVLLEYTGDKAEEGLNPDDTPINVSEITNTIVVENVINDLDLSFGVEDIRSNIIIEPVIPLEETQKKAQSIESGTEYSFFPTRYLVSYTVDSDFSQAFAKQVLDKLLTKYYAFYSNKYVEKSLYPDNTTKISLDTYDYLECADLLKSNASSIITYCSSKDETFHSAVTGCSFLDLKLEFEHWRDNSLFDLKTYILNNKLTTNKNLLIQKEENKIDRYKINIEKIDTNIEEQRDIINKFTKKTLEGQVDMSDLEEFGIVTDVEEYYKNSRNTETTYDMLINKYANLLIEKNNIEKDLKESQDILEIYKNTEATVSEGEVAKQAEKSLEENIEVFKELYDIFSQTADEYYKVRSASYLRTESNVYTKANINIKIYVALALILFFILGIGVAILLGRGTEIICMVFHEDKTGKLPTEGLKDEKDNDEDI